MHFDLKLLRAMNRRKQLAYAYKVGVGLLIVLVLPFVIVLALALFGVRTSELPGFSSLLMGSLTAAGALALLAAIWDGLRNRHTDWFWLFLAASATLFWGSVFLVSLPAR